MTIRKRISEDPEISKVFRVLTEEDLIPGEFRACKNVDNAGTENINVLFIVTIGVTWGGVDYLIESLRKLARQCTARFMGASKAEKKYLKGKIGKLEKGAKNEPSLSEFHPDFTDKVNAGEGDMRKAFFLAYDEENKYYIRLDKLLEEIDDTDKNKYV